MLSFQIVDLYWGASIYREHFDMPFYVSFINTSPISSVMLGLHRSLLWAPTAAAV